MVHFEGYVEGIKWLIIAIFNYEKCYIYQISSLKVDFQVMCHRFKKSIILKNVHVIISWNEVTAGDAIHL